MFHSAEKVRAETLRCFRTFLVAQLFLIREEGVCHDFFSKILSHSTEKIRRWTLLCFGKNPVSKKFMDSKGTSLLSVDTFLFHSAKKTRAETVRCFRKYLVLQMFFDKRRGGCITTFLPKSCLTVPKKFVDEPFCVSEKIRYRKILRIVMGLHYYLLIFFCSRVPKLFVPKHFGVSENFWFRKFFSDERRWGLSRFFFPSLCLTVRKKFVGEPFSVPEKIRYRKNLRIMGGIHYYLLIFLCSTVPKNFVRKHFGVSETFWFRNFFWQEKRRLYHDFLSKSLSHSTEKIRRETLLCFRILRVSESFMDQRRGGCITFFCQNFWITIPQNVVGEPFCVS